MYIYIKMWHHKISLALERNWDFMTLPFESARKKSNSLCEFCWPFLWHFFLFRFVSLDVKLFRKNHSARVTKKEELKYKN